MLPIDIIARVVKKPIEIFDIWVIIKWAKKDNIIDLTTIPIETKPITLVGNFFNLFVRSKIKYLFKIKYCLYMLLVKTDLQIKKVILLKIMMQIVLLSFDQNIVLLYPH